MKDIELSRRIRNYAMGNQDIDKYKELLGKFDNITWNHIPIYDHPVLFVRRKNSNVIKRLKNRFKK